MSENEVESMAGAVGEDMKLHRDSARSVGPVVRAVNILRVIAESPDDLTLSEIADQVRLPRPSAHRQLRVLTNQGMIEHDPETRRYRSGPEFYRLGALIVGSRRLADFAMPILESLARDTDESSLLALYHPEGHYMSYVAQIPSTHPLGYQIQLNTPVPLVWGATGRAMLAFLPEAKVEDSVRIAEPSADGQMPKLKDLLEELAVVRRAGHASTHGQRIPGAHSISAPVFGSSQRVMGSISITIPEVRFDPNNREQLATLVMNRAAELTELLGGTQQQIES
jgi:DNA-binding IclR family transcriptional regulator